MVIHTSARFSCELVNLSTINTEGTCSNWRVVKQADPTFTGFIYTIMLLLSTAPVSPGSGFVFPHVLPHFHFAISSMKRTWILFKNLDFISVAQTSKSNLLKWTTAEKKGQHAVVTNTQRKTGSTGQTGQRRRREGGKKETTGQWGRRSRKSEQLLETWIQTERR